MVGSYHALLHGDDLLAVDLPQSADVAFQGALQGAAGLGRTRARSVQIASSSHARERIL